MTKEQTIKELEAMRVKVIRELPHVNCKPEKGEPCNCYKYNMLTELDQSIWLIKR